ncbi:type II secretion system protein [Thiomicrorhabdus sp. Milos-T2]|uniref:type II secretion system protein n=1 Tax=Thiomicrorhabdus sp. Milos-T2 TaxID=90814 RepID=UPI00049471DB|nr:prepilin-type N-terminal cleavage/methylation domain-containing protein [Thiomicrorhabdus sp. Milos-T2]
MLQTSNILNVKRSKGFTLVELSIVLLIISLLVGGAFKAVAMVENAKVNRLINDLQSFQTAYYGYYSRLGDYPGNGTAFDQFIDYDAVGVDDGTFFQDLFDQGFIKNPKPVSSLVDSGIYFATFLPTSGSVGLLTGTILGKNQVCITLLKKDNARQFDISLDDGAWNTGTIRSDSDFDTAQTHTMCLQI